MKEIKYTKFEKARIIGARALQISMGAPFMLQLIDQDLQRIRYSTIEIAKLEFEKDVIPITVQRPSPSTFPSSSNQINKESLESRDSTGDDKSEKGGNET